MIVQLIAPHNTCAAIVADQMNERKKKKTCSKLMIRSATAEKIMKITASIDNCFFEDAHWPKERTNYSTKESVTFRKQYTRNMHKPSMLIGYTLLFWWETPNIRCGCALFSCFFFLSECELLAVRRSIWMRLLCVYAYLIFFRPYSTSSANQTKRLGKNLHCKI